MKTAKKKGFMDGYKTYDTSEGYGSRQQWKSTFYTRMTGEEAQTIIDQEEGTPWEILGVSREATQEQIKKAFRRLINEWHPDKNPHRINKAEEMSKKIIAAYTILSNQ